MYGDAEVFRIVDLVVNGEVYSALQGSGIEPHGLRIAMLPLAVMVENMEEARQASILDCADDERISANRIMVVRMDFTRRRFLFSLAVLPMVTKYFICEFIQNNISAVGTAEIVM
ncbi:MAG: hypothetical protein MZV63_56825 [Marinilabiliales bacterium]|nr:hypothetical protein [Marinilabiliales bacterium]